MDKRVRVLVAVCLALALIAGGVTLYIRSRRGPAEQKATFDDIAAIRSRRSGTMVDAVVVGDDPFLALVGTPVACQYTEEGVVAVPLLIAGVYEPAREDGPSSAVGAFLAAYQPSDVARVSVPDEAWGPLGSEAAVTIDGGAEAASLATARTFWDQSDGAVLVSPDEEGYALGLEGALLACYLNIPVIVCGGTGRAVRDLLDDLGVDTTIVAGDVEGYGRVWRLERGDSARILATGVDGRSLIAERWGGNVTYVAVANPLDAWKPKVLDSVVETFTGTVTSSDTGSTSDPSLDPNAPRHYVTIPEAYTYANVRLLTRMEFSKSPFGRTPDEDGQRCYTYFGIDADKDGIMIEDADSAGDHLQFMVPSLSYMTERDGSGRAVAALGYMEKPIYRSTGEHVVQMIATLHWQPPGLPPPETSYSIEVAVERLDRPDYPLMPGLSSVAPYLAAARGGVILADPDFSLHRGPLAEFADGGDPAQNPKAIPLANQKTLEVKSALNNLLAGLVGSSDEPQALAGACRGRGIHVAFVADTNMVPWHYYPTSGQEAQQQEGYEVPGDAFYADVDADPDHPLHGLDGQPIVQELAVGRVTGWDAQDASALVARTLFYDDIVGSFRGHSGEWRGSALNTFGSQVPVGFSATVVSKLDAAFTQAGFHVDTTHVMVTSHRTYSQRFYEESNFIYLCAHGFYYWFVPPGYRPDGVGGGYDVAHVREMTFGPSVLFASSCVTGKIDGLQGYNCLSQTFLHRGMNAYIGASRLSWGGVSIASTSDSGEAFGAYVGLLMYGFLTGYLYDKHGGLIAEGVGDLTIGEALMNAKNLFAANEGLDDGGPNSDTLAEFNLFGDPAFNPFEPNHQG